MKHNLITTIKRIASQTRTENNDLAYTTTGDPCLDFFSLIGGCRDNHADAAVLFTRALAFDKKTAVKILFHLRNVRGGLGERDNFRLLLTLLARSHPRLTAPLIPLIFSFGRYDDLLVLLHTPLVDKTVDLIARQLEEDKQAIAQGRPISLLAKWLPSINTSSSQARSFARKLCLHLGLSYKQYRQLLARLRKDLIIENNLRERRYDFDYSAVPGGAMFKYRDAFIRNDLERFREYVNGLKSGKGKVLSKTIYPYQIASAIASSQEGEERDLLEEMWKNLLTDFDGGNTIVVRDGSYSMVGLPLQVATSLAILFASKLRGELRNRFITFSAKPELVELPDGSLYDQVAFANSFDDYANTDLSRVYMLIYQAMKSNPDAKIDRIVIISDMEFDQGVDCDKTTYEMFAQMFERAKLVLPEVVFWNVAARSIHFPVTAQMPNVKLVSGFSPHIMKSIVENTIPLPLDFMNKVLEPYAFIDDLIETA